MSTLTFLLPSLTSLDCATTLSTLPKPSSTFLIALSIRVEEFLAASAALAEQNTAVTGLAKDTEQVAQMSEENSGAASSLLQLANELEGKAVQVKEAVEVFQV